METNPEPLPGGKGENARERDREAGGDSMIKILKPLIR